MVIQQVLARRPACGELNLKRHIHRWYTCTVTKVDNERNGELYSRLDASSWLTINNQSRWARQETKQLLAA